MMTRLIQLCPLILLATVPLLAQRNPRATSKLELAGKFVMVEYGRPSLKGRDMLGLAEVGKVWRMGADKSTTFTSDGKASFGKVTVPEGTYSLWLRKVGDKSFELVFNKKSGQWGTQYESIDDLASVPLTFSEASESVEVFTINLKQGAKSNVGDFEILWGKTVLKAPFTLK
jgi:Protein of unknown function (DUF2911)